MLQGDDAKVRELLEEGANPNAKDHAGWTPLVSSKILYWAFHLFYMKYFYQTIECSISFLQCFKAE